MLTLHYISPDSPRVYVSTNPWKITATFQTVSSTKEEYLATIENLKANTPPEPKKSKKRSKLELAHISLIEALEARIEAIDVELAVSGCFLKIYSRERTPDSTLCSGPDILDFRYLRLIRAHLHFEHI